MDISKDELDKDLSKILRNYYKINSLSSYNDNYASFCLIEELYRELYNIDINKKYPNVFNFKNTDNNLLDYYFDDFNKNYLFNYRLIKKIIDTYNKTNFYEIPNYDTNTLSKKEYLEIIRDFLYVYDNKIGKTFDKNIMDNKISNKNEFLGDSGFSYAFKSLGKNYILLKDGYTIESAITLVHEIGHVYQFNTILERDSKQYFNVEKSYLELFPTYLERTFNRYLINNHIYLKDSIISENYFLSNLRLFAYNFLEMYDVKDYDLYDKEEIMTDLLYFYGLYLTVLLEGRDLKDNFNELLCYSGLSSKEDELRILELKKEDLLKSKKLNKVLLKHKSNLNKYVEGNNGD